MKTRGYAYGVMLGVLLLSGSAAGQWDTDSVYDAHTQRGIDAVYDLDFADATREFTTMIDLRPDNPAGHFFLAMVDWERISIDIDNETLDDTFYSKLDSVIDLCDRLLDANPNDIAALFFKGGAIGFRGRLRAHRNQWLRAANDGRRALPILRKLTELSPENHDALLGEGIYDYFAVAIPEEYPFMKPFMIMFPGGNKEKGINELRQASEKAKYAAVEATYFLMQVYYTYEHQPGNALPLAKKLSARFPDNPQFERYLGRCYVQLGRWSEVFQVFFDIEKKAQRNATGYSTGALREAEYYIGMYHFTMKNQGKALPHLYVCDSLSRILDLKEGPSGFMTMANLRIGQIYDLQGKREYALQQYKKVIALKDYENAHALAEEYTNKPFTLR